MIQIAVAVLLFTLALFLYTYFGYPLILWIIGRFTRRGMPSGPPAEWPTVSISVPAYNEARQVRELIGSLLAIEYPRDRLQILIISDASSDGTDEIVQEYADRGIDLLRMPQRGGKTKAEAAAAEHLRGEIVVNTDASIRIRPDAIKALVSVFRDPSIGLASGRDVSVSPGQALDNLSESGYVGYEMAIRDLETRVAGIIGASGCFYAIRADLHRKPLPDALSRDFAAALHTIQAGYRAVSVPQAVCLVPRTTSLRAEYRRKVRTITRGMETLWHERIVLSPFHHPVFSWMLVSHKLCRWGLPRSARPRQHDRALLHRLAEHLEHMASELGQLVEEEHAVVGEAHLTRAKGCSAADQTRVAHGVVRSTERPHGDERAPRREAPGHRMDLGDREGFIERQRWKDPRQPAREHGLPGTGRSDQQKVVPSRRRDLQRAPSGHLAAHIREVQPTARGCGGQECAGVHLRAGQHRSTVQVRDQRGERRRADHLESADGRRFRGVLLRDDESAHPRAAAGLRDRRRAPAGPAHRAPARRRRPTPRSAANRSSRRRKAGPTRSEDRTRSHPSSRRPGPG